MILKRFFHEGLAQASYLAGCERTGKALIVDPNRDIDQYLREAEREGMEIEAVTETHIHADYASGARELARAAGATLDLSDEGPAEWKYQFAEEMKARLLRGGDSFRVGDLLIEVLHTPGHTPEHLSFLLTDTATADQPMGLFSGDFLFVGDVGRPDLLEKAAGVEGTMEEGARQLFRSLRQARELPDYLQVWPGHGAGSACGRALGAVPQSTAGYEKHFNWAFQIDDEESFVRAVLDEQPDVPPYFAEMKRINKEGVPARPTEPVPSLAVEEIEKPQERGIMLVDVRPASDYAAGHLPGTLNLSAGDDFLAWAGWFLPYARDLVLVGDEATVTQARAALMLIGLDRVTGYIDPDVLRAWGMSRGNLATFQRVGVEAFQEQLASNNAALLDVRTPAEYARGHVPGSQNIPLSQLSARLLELPAGQPVLVYCQGGGRSPIAASLLKARGWENVVEMQEGFSGWEKQADRVEYNQGESDV
jgi:hydroxyacylglutathione hydrolase